MGLVRVHASHNLPVDRSGAHPAAPFSRLEIGEDLGLVREGNKKKSAGEPLQVNLFFKKGTFSLEEKHAFSKKLLDIQKVTRHF